MKILILAAGYGTRLYPVITDTPKPLLDIAGRPLIDYVLEKVRGLEGLDEVVVITNNKFYSHFCDWSRTIEDLPCPVHVMNDGTLSPEDRLGSVGDIEFAIEKHAIDDDLLVLGGDNLFDYSLEDFYRFARSQEPRVTIGLYDIHDLKEASKFGVVQLDGEAKIISFEEKPDDPQSTLVAMCFYYFPRESLDLVCRYVKSAEKCDKAGDYIHWLTEEDEVFGYVFEGKWYDIGSLEAYRKAQDDFINMQKHPLPKKGREDQ